jgi:DNA-3-methyladenine glycosylase I
MSATQESDGRMRCFGGPDDALMMRYHDEEWGVPSHDDRRLFESLALDGFQAGLSWRTILHKRDAFRRAFDDFDPERVARYGDEERQRLMADAGIVRNGLKIAATIGNAQKLLDVRRDHGSFDAYIWGFTQHMTLRAAPGLTLESMPASSAESCEMSRDLKGRGFRFVGTTICYAFMQAVGMVNDHIDLCWRYDGPDAIKNAAPRA